MFPPRLDEHEIDRRGVVGLQRDFICTTLASVNEQRELVNIEGACFEDFKLETRGNSLKRIAIVQSSYMPWKGYFDLIASVDEFVLYDDAQFTKRDWRNRNRIKTPHGLKWLTVPIKVKGNFRQTIRSAEIDGEGWACSHWKTLAQNYRRAPHFEEVAAMLEPFYVASRFTHLSVLNRAVIETVCSYLGIETKVTNSWDYRLTSGRSERLADMCRQANATEYISGPAAKGYLNEGLFREVGIKVAWFDYSDYPEYPQLWGQFEHGVTVLDLLFNCGKSAGQYMKYVKP